MQGKDLAENIRNQYFAKKDELLEISMEISKCVTSNFDFEEKKTSDYQVIISSFISLNNKLKKEIEYSEEQLLNLTSVDALIHVDSYSISDSLRNTKLENGSGEIEI